MFSKAAKMHILDMIKLGCAHSIQSINDYAYIIFDLLDEGLIALDEFSNPYLTYFGFKELEDWDPILGVSFNHQLILPVHGEA